MNPQHVLIWQVVTMLIGGITVLIAFIFGQSPANAFGAGSIMFIVSFLTVMVVNNVRSR